MTKQTKRPKQPKQKLRLVDAHGHPPIPKGATLESLAGRTKSAARLPNPAMKTNLAKGSAVSGERPRRRLRKEEPKQAPAKPQTSLQKANTQVQWVTNFRMHTPAEMELSAVEVSSKTWHYLEEYKKLANLFKASLLADYVEQKARHSNTQ